MSIVKDVPYVYETEKDLPTGTQIKNLLNPYIQFRMERFIETCKAEGKPIYLTEGFVDTIDSGCKTLLDANGINVRKTLAREHAVNYIINEYGGNVFLKPKHEFKVK